MSKNGRYIRRALQLLIVLLLAVTDSLCVTTRISNRTEAAGAVLYVSLDFDLNKGEHISAPIGKGVGGAPKIVWQNAEKIAEFWPKAGTILDFDGKPSSYIGYCKSFSIKYKLKIKEVKKPVKYEVSYVVCGDACIPKFESGTLQEANGKLSDKEITEAFGKSASESPWPGILLSILGGLLGGLILNCMPCVFPIITLKVFSIVKGAKHEKSEIRRHTLAYVSGIVVTFVVFGAIVMGIRKSFKGIGWGFYMQDPTFVFCLLLLFLVSSLNFLGDFFGNIMPSVRVKPKKNYVSDVFSGMLSVVASTACVGPFSGVAIASALLTDNLVHSLLLFLSLGIGLGLPFVLIAIFPNSARFIPKSGEWMLRFKEFMGFSMLLSCIWPFWVLMTQLPSASVIVIMVCCILISLFAWAWKHSKKTVLFKGIPLLGAVTSVAIGIYSTKNTPINAVSEIVWLPYTDEIFDDLMIKREPVFLDFTATWCLTCKFNERLFSDSEVASAFLGKRIKALRCDWTNKNERITELLKSYGAVAIPLYVYYPGGGSEYIKLPTLLTKKELLKALNERGEQ
jgi:thiol:disulfide interchange protein DsbD